MIYAICEDLYPEVEKKLKKCAKKCEQLNLPFVFEHKGEEVREVYNENLGFSWYYTFFLIEVEGTAKVDDWEFVATMENYPTGNIIRRCNNEIEIPERFKHSENFCEHCTTRRARKNLYLIHNVKSDDWKQVGGSCLKLYTGGLSMEYIAKYMDGITELEKYDGIISTAAKPMYNVQSIIARSLEVTNALGYFPSSDSLSTRWIVSMLMNRHLDQALETINQELKSRGQSLSSRDLCLEESFIKVDKIIEYYLSLTDDSEFTHNVQTLIKSGVTSFKNFGFLCYLPTGYAKHIKQIEEKQKAMSIEVDAHFGKSGQRYKDEKVAKVDLLACWDNPFGYGLIKLYKIVLASGEVLTWKTNNNLKPRKKSLIGSMLKFGINKLKLLANG